MPDSRRAHASSATSPAPCPAGKRFRTPEAEPASKTSAAPGSRGSRNVAAPINAAAAAKRAAHATRPDEEARARRAAAGSVRATTAPRERSRVGVLVAVLAGFAIAAAIIYVLGSALLGVALQDDRPDAQAATGQEAPAADAESNESARSVARFKDGDTLDAMSYTYSITQGEDGAYIFGYQIQGSSAAPVTLFTLAGDPVGFVCLDSQFYVVSNTENGFCVQSFLPGDGSMPVNFRTGEVTVADLDLDGTELLLTDTSGKVYTVELGGAA